MRIMPRLMRFVSLTASYMFIKGLDLRYFLCVFAQDVFNLYRCMNV